MGLGWPATEGPHGDRFRVLVILLCAGGTLLVLSGTASAEEFWGDSLSFLYNCSLASSWGPASTTYSLSNTGSAAIDVDAWDDSGWLAMYTIPPGNTVLHEAVSPDPCGFPWKTERTSKFVTRFTTPSDDLVVSQFAAPVDGGTATHDASTLIPASRLGVEHVVPSIREGTGWKAQVVVIATQGGTTVTVTPTANVPAGPGVPAMAPGVPYSFAMGEFDSLRLEVAGDPSGTIVTSNRPVAVSWGLQCGVLGQGSCNHFEEQVLPVHHAGLEFVGCGPDNAEVFQVYRVVATAPGATIVTLDPAPVIPSPHRGPSWYGYGATGVGFTILSPTEIQLSGPGSWFQFDSSDNTFIKADRPIAVSEGTGQKPGHDLSAVLGDPNVVSLLPSSRWQKTADFWVPDGSWTRRMVFVHGRLGTSVTVDGTPTIISDAAGGSAFGCVTVPIVGGQHVVTGADDFHASVMTQHTGYSQMWYLADTDLPPPPVAEFAATPAPYPPGLGVSWFPTDWIAGAACAGAPVDVTDLSLPGLGAIVQTQWTWGDGSPDETYTDPPGIPLTVFHSFALPGIFTVTLTAWDEATMDDISYPVVVADCKVPPVAAASNSGGKTCVDTLAHFFADDSFDPDGGPVTWSWDFGDGSPPASGNPVSHQYLVASTFTITLTVTDDEGSSSTTTLQYPAPGDPNCVPQLDPLQDLCLQRGAVVTLLLHAMDSDGPLLELQLASEPWPEASFDAIGDANTAAGAYTFVFDPPGAGPFRVNFRATDGLSYDQEGLELRLCTVADIDRDGIEDAGDNCPAQANRDQADGNRDGIGDACSPQSRPTFLLGEPGMPATAMLDRDGDGILDVADNCPSNHNRDQADFDRDALGDACDSDRDGDGIADQSSASNALLDNCPATPNAGQEDLDVDGAGDACDDASAGRPVQPGGLSALQEAPPSTPGSLWVLVGIAIAAPLVAAWSLRHRIWPPLVVVFSRIAGIQILEHPLRARLMELIRERPGMHLYELVRAVGRGRGSVRHHLAVLARAGIIQARSQGKYRFFFPEGPTTLDLSQQAVLRTPMAQEVLSLARKHPGTTVGELHRMMGISRGTAVYHLQRMESAGLIVLTDTERGVAVYPPPEPSA